MAWENAGEKTKNPSHKKKRLIWIFKRRKAEKKGQEGSSDFRETSIPWEENGSLIPQLAQQVQFTAKVGNLLSPHLSFKRVPRFSSTVVSSAFFKHQRRWNCPHLSVESEFEGFGFSAGVMVRKGEDRGKVPKLFYQSSVRKTTWCPLQSMLSTWNRKEVTWNSVQDMHELDKAMWNLVVTSLPKSHFLDPNDCTLNNSTCLQKTV